MWAQRSDNSHGTRSFSRAQPALGGAAGAGVAAAAGALLEAEPAWLGARRCRGQLHRRLSRPPRAAPRPAARVTSAWQRGDVSNYEYLLYLNLAAGRSFNDLTQWPVFPWVLADYRSPVLDLGNPASFRDLSKPVGALNAARLSSLRERSRQLASQGERPFLYGTHYSTPGYTLFWLLRALPAHALRLQGGRCDAPDRLFCSVREAWEGVLASHADVKELIPEFYAPPEQGDAWLLNGAGLALGSRQSGQAVGDVQLPSWAASPAHFLACMRCALECPHVSRALPSWIDLVFGSAQRGEAAVARDNVFHPLTYEGSVDVEAVTDPVQRAALEAQIQEFGQTPRQLFPRPHPPRGVAPEQPLPHPTAPPPQQQAPRAGSAALIRMLLVRSCAPLSGAAPLTRLPPSPTARLWLRHSLPPKPSPYPRPRHPPPPPRPPSRTHCPSSHSRRLLPTSRSPCLACVCPAPRLPRSRCGACAPTAAAVPPSLSAPTPPTPSAATPGCACAAWRTDSSCTRSPSAACRSPAWRCCRCRLARLPARAPPHSSALWTGSSRWRWLTTARRGAAWRRTTTQCPRWCCPWAAPGGAC